MTEEEVRKIVSETVKETVKQTLIQIGIDVNDPLEYQRDMLHVRRWRESVETLKDRSIMTVVLAAVGFVITGTCGYLLMLVSKGS